MAGGAAATTTATTTAAALSRGAQVYARKRKARQEQVEEVQFDPRQRRTFLTGFHKRKVQRREQAQAQAAAQSREERLATRREQRDQKREQLAQRLLLSEADGKGASDASGAEEEESDGVDVDVLRGDSSVTTVTVTRDFDPADLGDAAAGLEKALSPQDLADRLRDGLQKRMAAGSDDDDDDGDDGDDKGAGPAKQKKKKKSPKFRYETKAARAAARDKAKAAKAARNKSFAEQRKARQDTRRRQRR
ncbi:hypothetical protein H4R18_002946 [Coemansia javaensis]|uniref:Nucleolar protein 12 n=1 Tax=Coemansia javaensis TaxID=2761396 RepID=A0A9W8HGX4_9FUNG|nr:hypothetical protein H4R18_002946 [Coemansia javaensis]